MSEDCWRFLGSGDPALGHTPHCVGLSSSFLLSTAIFYFAHNLIDLLVDFMEVYFLVLVFFLFFLDLPFLLLLGLPVPVFLVLALLFGHFLVLLGAHELADFVFSDHAGLVLVLLGGDALAGSVGAAAELARLLSVLLLRGVVMTQKAKLVLLLLSNFFFLSQPSFSSANHYFCEDYHSQNGQCQPQDLLLLPLSLLRHRIPGSVNVVGGSLEGVGDEEAEVITAVNVVEDECHNEGGQVDVRARKVGVLHEHAPLVLLLAHEAQQVPVNHVSLRGGRGQGLRLQHLRVAH